MSPPSASEKIPAPLRPYRVVQWATGNIGTRSLRTVIEHPNLELVGLYVHSDGKLGRDAGEIAGIGRIGIAATNSIERIIAARPDCVLYMQQGCDFDDVCRLLSAGVNIVTTRGSSTIPRPWIPVCAAIRGDGGGAADPFVTYCLKTLAQRKDARWPMSATLKGPSRDGGDECVVDRRQFPDAGG